MSNIYVLFPALYGIGAALFFSPGDFTSYIQMVQGWELNPAVLFMAKSTVAFPLIYHYINGIRHLVSDSNTKYNHIKYNVCSL